MFRHLRFHRPLVFLDVETTGVDPQRDRIIEIALLRLAPGADPRTVEARFHPERPVPPSASAVHGIYDEHLVHCPTFREAVAKVARWIGDADLAGFGIARFDLPFLVAEFERAGWPLPLSGRKVVDALMLFHRREPRDLAAAVRLYCGRDHPHAHRAAHDVEATAAILDAMLGKYKDVPRSVSELHQHLIEVDIEGWFKRTNGVLIFARGKHRDVPLLEIAHRDPSYLRWLADKVLPDARHFLDEARRLVSV
jgi:DNA polymerase-3 subunit epsilon